MQRGKTGNLRIISSVGREKVRAFIPHPLPPDPAIVFDPALRDRMDRALVAVGPSGQRISSNLALFARPLAAYEIAFSHTDVISICLRE